jgi:uncharacterized membrane protein YfcA
MYNGLLHAHSGLRWVALILIVAAIFNALSKRKSSTYEKKDRMLNLFSMVSLHVQLLIGLVLYFMSPKVSFDAGWMANKITRFFGMEHFLLMVLAIVVITIGRRKAENAAEASQKHQLILKWFVIGLVLILAGIPWPFRGMGSGWF